MFPFPLSRVRYSEGGEWCRLEGAASGLFGGGAREEAAHVVWVETGGRGEGGVVKWWVKELLRGEVGDEKRATLMGKGWLFGGLMRRPIR